MKRKGIVLLMTAAMLATVVPLGTLTAATGEEEAPVVVEAPAEQVGEENEEKPTEPPTPEATEAPAEEAQPEAEEQSTEAPEVTEQPTEAPEAVEQPAEEPETAEQPEETPEVSEPPVEEEQPAEEPEAPFEASVRIVLENAGDICYGDRVTLRAVVEANAAYTVAWEYYNVHALPDENPWVGLKKGETYVFDVNEENAALVYRAVVNGEIVSDTYTLPAVMERPEEEQPEAEEPEAEEPTAETPVGKLDPDRKVQIHAVYDGDALSFGDEVTLVAEMSGYDNAVYELQWQTSEDNATWSDVPGATGASCTVTMTEENYYAFWRVFVTITEILPAA